MTTGRRLHGLPLFLAVGAVLLLAPGCQSSRFTTTIHQIDQPQIGIEAKFRIATVEPPAKLRMGHSPQGYCWEWVPREELKVDPLSGVPRNVQVQQISEQYKKVLKVVEEQHAARLAERLARECCDRYPDLFSASTEALPLRVRITETDKSDYSVGLGIPVLLATGLIVGGVFPSPT